MIEYLIGSISLMLLAYAQNISFSVVSRSRNRSSIKYHLVAAFFSNAVWYLTFRSLVTSNMTMTLFPWYCIGTMFGSVTGVKISMWIESRLHISSDDHIKPKINIETLEKRVTKIERQTVALEPYYNEDAGM